VSALKPSTIVALDFDLVVNCTKEVPNMNLPPDVERLKLWLDDTEETDLTPSLHMAVDYIRMIMEADGKVLVHCLAGISRSAAVCLGYLVKFESMTLRQAYEHLAARRARVRPNLGFWRQLIDFESEITGQISSVRIKKIDDQDELPDVYESAFERDTPSKDDTPSELITETQETTPSKSKSIPLIESTNKLLRDERKRQRQMSDGECGKRFVPKLEPLIECEQ